METTNDSIISIIAGIVRERMEGAEGGHDWWHVYRVWRLARTIAKSEPADMLVVELAALLHDIADAKFHGGDENAGPSVAREILVNQSLDEEVIRKITEIIRYISFKNSFNNSYKGTIEFEIVQDADRLDALGAIGIARTFNYGGFRNRPIYDPDIKPEKFASGEDYKKSEAPTINHFYEKLLLLKDKMNTDTGKKMALKRHLYLEKYLEQFYSEWNGEN